MTQAGFLDIFEATGGTPREIVNLCARLIDEMGTRGLTTADIESVQTTIDDYKDVHSSRPAPEEVITEDQEA